MAGLERRPHRQPASLLRALAFRLFGDGQRLNFRNEQKDPNFAASLQQSLRAAAQDTTPRPNDSSVLTFTYPGSFKPDAVLSLANTAAIYDAVRRLACFMSSATEFAHAFWLQSYSKYRNVFRLVAPAGRQYLFQAHNEEELNSWLSAINFAAAFKSANIRIRPLQPDFSSPLPSSSHPALSAFPRPATADNTRSSRSKPSSPRPTTPRMVRSAAQDSLASAQETQQPNGSSSTTPRPSSATPNLPHLDKPSTIDGDDETPLSMLLTPRAASPGTSASGVAGGSQPITARADLLRVSVPVHSQLVCDSNVLNDTGPNSPAPCRDSLCKRATSNRSSPCQASRHLDALPVRDSRASLDGNPAH